MVHDVIFPSGIYHHFGFCFCLMGLYSIVFALMDLLSGVLVVVRLGVCVHGAGDRVPRLHQCVVLRHGQHRRVSHRLHPHLHRHPGRRHYGPRQGKKTAKLKSFQSNCI